MKYIASCSCGKDSLAMLQVIKNNSDKYPLDEIVICKVKATQTLGGAFSLQDEFIDKMIPRLEENLNVPVVIVQSEKSFEDYFYTVKQKGNHKGEIYGFPYTIGAWCNNRLKILPLEKYFKKQGEHMRYIGIAHDEPKRFMRLSNNEIAPLYNERIVESEAKQICIDNDMLSPIYKYFDRDGCWFCPKQSLHSLKVIYDKFPDLWERLRQWQNDSPIPFSTCGSIFEIETRFKNGYIPRKKNKTNKTIVHNNRV